METIDVALIRQAARQIDITAYVLTDTAIIAALREASTRGVKVRIWRDASMAQKVADFDVEAQLGGRTKGIEVRSSSPRGELMHLKAIASTIPYCRLGQFQLVGRDARGQ